MRALSKHVASFVIAFLLTALPRNSEAQRPVELSPAAPKDRPIDAAQRCQLRAMVAAMAPYVAQARATYPEARERFVRGLPRRQSMFVTTRLVDSEARVEQVFVAVDSIRGHTIAGRIWSPIQVVRGYSYRQPYAFADTALVDWMIARSDGSEEGNVVGKFLDVYRPPTTCADSGAAG